mgnify:CR=1 FL=1
MQYQSWSITELQNWLSSARRILRRYRARIVDAPIHTTSTLPSEHIVHCPPNTNHYIASPITNYYKKKTSSMIPISVNPPLQHISNPTNNIASHLSSVRNPSQHSIKDYIRVPSLKQLPTTNSTPNNTNPQIINKNLIAKLKQNNKKSSVDIRNHNSVPINNIAPKLPSVRTPSPSTIKYSIPRVSSLKHLPPNDIYTNATHPDNRK